MMLWMRAFLSSRMRCQKMRRSEPTSLPLRPPRAALSVLGWLGFQTTGERSMWRRPALISIARVQIFRLSRSMGNAASTAGASYMGSALELRWRRHSSAVSLASCGRGIQVFAPMR